MISRRAKRSFLILSAVLWLLAVDQAAGASFKPGLKLGGGLANIFGQDAYRQEWQLSFFAGISVEFPVIKRLAATVELDFVRKGSVYRLEEDGLEYRERYLFDYLEVPVLVKYCFDGAKKMEFYVYAGPSVALNLKARLRVTFDDLEETVEVDNLGGTDLLLTGGVGTAVGFKPGSLILEVRYSHGLKSVATEPGADIRNRSLLLLAGFKF